MISLTLAPKAWGNHDTCHDSQRTRLPMKRSSVIGCTVVLAALLGLSTPAQAADGVRVLRLSHQFPAAVNDEGDYRDRLAHRFAEEVEKESGGKLKVQIFAGASLMEPRQQIDAMMHGSLDLSAVPLGYAGGKIPAANLGFLPTIINSYEQGMKWADAPVGEALNQRLEKRGLRILTWIWQAGVGVSNKHQIKVPADVKGLQVRGAGRPINLVLQAAGGGIATFPPNEGYNALQTGVVDAEFTSSASMLSFHYYEISKYATSALGKSWVYYLLPLIISEKTYQSLSPEEQKIVTSVGKSLGQFAVDACKADDKRFAKVFADSGVQVDQLSQDDWNQWRKLAQESAWKDFAKRVKGGDELIKLALEVQ